MLYSQTKCKIYNIYYILYKYAIWYYRGLIYHERSFLSIRETAGDKGKEREYVNITFVKITCVRVDGEEGRRRTKEWNRKKRKKKKRESDRSSESRIDR